MHFGALELLLILGCFDEEWLTMGEVVAAPLGVGEVALLCGSSTLSSFILVSFWWYRSSDCCFIRKTLMKAFFEMKNTKL